MRLMSRAGDLVQATRMTFVLTHDLTLEIFSDEAPVEWCSPLGKNHNVLARRIRATAGATVIDACKQFLDELHGSCSEQPFIEWQDGREQINWYWEENDTHTRCDTGLRHLAEHVAELLDKWQTAQFEWHASKQTIQFVLFAAEGVICMDFAARCFDEAAAQCVVHGILRLLTGLSECRVEKMPVESGQEKIWVFNAAR